MAFKKEHKSVMLTQYVDWLKNSQAVFMLEYTKMTVKDVDALRAKIREAGGEAHVVKNTLMKKALEQAGYKFSGEFSNTTLAGFAYKDAPAIAKIFSEISKDSEVFKLKAGFLEKQAINTADVVSLANLPPLPVMRAKLLGLLQAPAGRLVRTLAEPARQMASVLKSYSEKAAIPA